MFLFWSAVATFTVFTDPALGSAILALSLASRKKPTRFYMGGKFKVARETKSPA